MVECSDDSLNIESDSHLGPNFPRSLPSLAIILAPSNLLHCHEFTSALIGTDIKTKYKHPYSCIYITLNLRSRWSYNFRGYLGRKVRDFRFSVDYPTPNYDSIIMGSCYASYHRYSLMGMGLLYKFYIFFFDNNT